MRIRNSSSFTTGRTNNHLTLVTPSVRLLALANACLEAEYAPLRKSSSLPVWMSPSCAIWIPMTG